MARKGEERRQYRRYTKRLPVSFVALGKSYKSFSCNISQKGLFIKTNRAFAPGSILDIELELPDGSIAKLKGEVKRAEKTLVNEAHNGMGVELIEMDNHFVMFIKNEFDEDIDYRPGASTAPQQSSTVSSKSSTAPHNNESAKADPAPPPGSGPDEAVIIRCTSCNVKNKIRKSKLHLGPICGKCKSPLQP